jgi:cytidine deaminase
MASRPIPWQGLSELAWQAREAAFVFDRVKVGCALLTEGGRLFAGCNVEQRFRSHDIHAEVNAISSMVAMGEREIAALLVVAETELFTPCGACMDWILQFAAPACQVGFQRRRGDDVRVFPAAQLMPFYPRA